MRAAPVLLPLALAACLDRDELVLDVEHYLAPCLKQQLELCPLVKREEDAAHKVFVDRIHGWSPAWGERSTLRVAREERFRTGGDPLIRYQLLRVEDVESVEPGTSFAFRINTTQQPPSQRAVTLEADGSGHLVDGHPLHCATEEDCARIAVQIEGRGFLEIRLTYGDHPDDPFLAEYVRFDVL